MVELHYDVLVKSGIKISPDNTFKRTAQPGTGNTAAQLGRHKNRNGRDLQKSSSSFLASASGGADNGTGSARSPGGGHGYNSRQGHQPAQGEMWPPSLKRRRSTDEDAVDHQHHAWPSQVEPRSLLPPTRPMFPDITPFPLLVPASDDYYDVLNVRDEDDDDDTDSTSSTDQRAADDKNVAEEALSSRCEVNPEWIDIDYARHVAAVERILTEDEPLEQGCANGAATGSEVLEENYSPPGLGPARHQLRRPYNSASMNLHARALPAYLQDEEEDAFFTRNLNLSGVAPPSVEPPYWGPGGRACLAHYWAAPPSSQHRTTSGLALDYDEYDEPADDDSNSSFSVVDSSAERSPHEGVMQEDTATSYLSNTEFFPQQGLVPDVQLASYYLWARADAGLERDHSPLRSPRRNRSGSVSSVSSAPSRGVRPRRNRRRSRSATRRRRSESVESVEGNKEDVEMVDSRDASAARKSAEVMHAQAEAISYLVREAHYEKKDNAARAARPRGIFQSFGANLNRNAQLFPRYNPLSAAYAGSTLDDPTSPGGDKSFGRAGGEDLSEVFTTVSLKHRRELRPTSRTMQSWHRGPGARRKIASDHAAAEMNYSKGKGPLNKAAHHPKADATSVLTQEQQAFYEPPEEDALLNPSSHYLMLVSRPHLRMQQMSQKSLLSVILDAGQQALPKILEYHQWCVDQDKGLSTGNWSLTTAVVGDTLPVTLDSPPEFAYASNFVCPVNRSLTRTPYLLACGHVLSRECVDRLSRNARASFKCPFCPRQQNSAAALPIKFAQNY
ncbi:unnamed protein product [Amoebophrya sp. A120]|nr:unnamed protein product [Amoebophrya sp. A120]CAD7975627.1 unnamed protein product [Amoebophrya sp. A120]|eukprot:GSA120T00012809001.1